MEGKSVVGYGVGAIGLLLAGYLFGASRAEPAPRGEGCEETESARRPTRAERSERLAAGHAVEAPPSVVASPASEGGCANPQAGELLVNRLRREAETLERQGPIGDEYAELRASNFQPQLQGWLESVAATHPGDAQQISAAVTERLCSDVPLSATEQLLLLSTVTHGALRGRSESGAVGCVLDRRIHGDSAQEDVVLWSALDAWHAQGSPQLPAIERLRAVAADTRTTSRLDGSRRRERQLGSAVVEGL
jgi:hypothetical protein